MSKSTQKAKVAERDTRRTVLITSGAKGSGRKGLSAGILLAHRHQRCREPDADMSWMSMDGKAVTSPGYRTTTDTSGMALSTMGYRHCGTIAGGPWRLSVCSSSSGIFLQMGGSGTIGQNHGQEHKEVFLEECSMPVRRANQANLQQWQAVRGVEFEEYCRSIEVKKCEISAGNPRANEAVEHMNGNVFTALAKALTGLLKGKWAEVLPNILWSIRTTATRPTGFSLFRLLYGVEAVTPEEIQAGSFRTRQQFTKDEDVSKDLLEETRLQRRAERCYELSHPYSEK